MKSGSSFNDHNDLIDHSTFNDAELCCWAISGLGPRD